MLYMEGKRISGSADNGQVEGDVAVQERRKGEICKEALVQYQKRRRADHEDIF